MLKFLVLVAVLFGVALGFHWLSDTSGEVTLTLAGTAYVVDLTTAVVALLATIVAALLLVWLLGALFGAPGRLRSFWRRRNAEHGRAAISRGLIAVAAGDLRTAERAMLDASRRAPDLPLARLLQAQTAQLKGDRAAARQIFQAMTEDRATRIAGLRGLYIEAEREGEHEAAHQIAERAREEAPSAPWAARALLRHQTAAHDWDGALKTLSGAADGRILDKRTARRQRAVILTAKAQDAEASDPDAARHAALEAHDLAPDLVPAAVIAGRLLSRQGDVRRATRVLEAAWKAAPHPDIAEAYLHVRAGDSAGDRLKRAETLFRMRPQADEGRIAVARAAIDAREFDRARDVLTPLLTTRPTQKALLVMADLVESETGDRGRAREWTARALRAPRDPVWTADGAILERWAPASPVSGRLDAVEWKVPVAELEAPHLEIDAEELKPPVLMAPEEAAMVPEAEAESPAAPEPRTVDLPAEPPRTQPEGEVAPQAEALPAEAAAAPEPAAPAQPARARPTAEAVPALHVVPPAEPDAEAAPDERPATPPHMPDDPGVAEEDQPEEKARRFRIL